MARLASADVVRMSGLCPVRAALEVPLPLPILSLHVRHVTALVGGPDPLNTYIPEADLSFDPSTHQKGETTDL